jgi:hypothetical protein
MPNHIMNRIIIDNKKTADEIASYLKTGNTVFDFNKIISMPEILADTEFSTEIIERAKNAIGYPLNKIDIIAIFEENKRKKIITKKIDSDDISKVIKCLQAYQETGYLYWYDWNIENWGTKWNSYEGEYVDETFTFQTAWANVHELIIKLSEKYTDVTFNYLYADEDIGSNTGFYEIKNGVVLSGMAFENHSQQAYNAYVELWGECDYLIRDDNGIYKLDE